MFRSGIRYQLINIATPGHTHDEQSLKTETEKTNERIKELQKKKEDNDDEIPF